MTLNKRKLKRLCESMWISLSQEQERLILETYGEEPWPYVWDEEGIVLGIRHIVSEKPSASVSNHLPDFLPNDEERQKYSIGSPKVQHSSSKTTANGIVLCRTDIQAVSKTEANAPVNDQEHISHRQLKITVDHDLAESFKAACLNAGVSMTSELSAFMSERIGSLNSERVKQNKPPSYSTKGKRRQAVKAIIAQLENILSAEERYWENIPVNLQSSYFFDNAESSVDSLLQAIEALNEAY